MARDTAEIGSDVVIGEGTPPVESTVEALIRAYNRLPLNTNLTAGDRMEWDGTDWVPAGDPSPTPIALTAGALAATVGSPALSAFNSRVPVWLLDAAATEIVAATIAADDMSDWSTFNVKAVVANATTDTGDYQMRCDRTIAADGDSFNTHTAGSSVVTTATSQYLRQTVTLLSGIAVPASGSALTLSVAREGGGGSDTKAGDLALVQVLIEKAS